MGGAFALPPLVLDKSYNTITTPPIHVRILEEFGKIQRMNNNNGVYCKKYSMEAGAQVAGNAKQKLKLLYLMKIFFEKSDENNALTMEQIISELKQYDIEAERKSLYRDIELLQEYGLDIVHNKNKRYTYALITREFELPELKLLVDAVQSSKFITKKKSTELIKKLEGLTSYIQARQLRRQVYVIDRLKAVNEKIYYHVDNLHSAIAQNKQVCFKYFRYTIDKKKEYRNQGNEYQVSPYALSWEQENYYLISYCTKHETKLTHFRVDRMDDIRIIDDSRVPLKAVCGEEELNLAQYSKGLFNMYAGEPEYVEIVFQNNLIDIVIDRFGEDVFLCRFGEEHFLIRTQVVLGKTFFAWLFQFGGEVRLISPKNAIEKIVSIAEEIVKAYQCPINGIE